ncbi:hypothetical protein [Chlorobium sp. N1]|uniref:hypothetical protein n=1 Tax=Chlorobium sp. N1 TaxID=2491138 RepID=UPI00103DEB76|nr:hypothetical protein [Chlorobium sp. N1]TCD47021.1 hypothetical protein E0L29_10325 [Chlorobium sp. N1]
MAFSTDDDLRSMLPAIFNYGVTSFEEYHAPAEKEVARDVRRLWIPRQYRVSFSEFDRFRLEAAQWSRAACCRVLGWHALARLATETDTEGFVAMIATYRAEYQAELEAVIADGVWYDTGDGLEWIESVQKAETSRIWR